MNHAIRWRLLGFTLFTGATFHLARLSVETFSAFSAAAWRFGIAAVIMLTLLAVKEPASLRSLQKNGWAYAAMGIIGIFGFNSFFFWGMKETSAINGSLIMATNPLLTTMLAVLLLKDRISRNQALGLACSLVGVVLVITQASWEMIQSLHVSRGDLFILLGNLCWALYSVSGRRFLKNSSSLATTAWTMAAGALCLGAAAGLDTQPVPFSNIPLTAWGAILFMAIFSSVLGYLWWNEGVKKLGTGKTAIFFNLVPVVTMLLSALMGTAITWVQAAGAVFVLVGVGLASGSLPLFRGSRSQSFPVKYREDAK